MLYRRNNLVVLTLCIYWYQTILSLNTTN